MEFQNKWAIILGGSSGFGLATVEKLAAHGMNIALLYREITAKEKIFKSHLEKLIQKYEVQILPYNLNALDEQGRQLFITLFKKNIKSDHCVHLLLHSIARGSLKPLINKNGNELSQEDIQLTQYAMATSLLDWTKMLLSENLFSNDARVIALTSEGAHKFWSGYAAVGMAKSALETLVTYMAVEFLPFGIKTNIIQAGMTRTPSFDMIPKSDQLADYAVERNPHGRMTETKDVANAIYLLCKEEASWINGSLIHVDGGEHCI